MRRAGGNFPGAEAGERRVAALGRASATGSYFGALFVTPVDIDAIESAKEPSSQSSVATKRAKALVSRVVIGALLSVLARRARRRRMPCLQRMSNAPSAVSLDRPGFLSIKPELFWSRSALARSPV